MKDDLAGGVASRDEPESAAADDASEERISGPSDTGPRLASGAWLVPGDTCQRIETADRIGVIVDTADYFEALRSAIAAAQHHVFIIGWDVDSRTRLAPDKRPADGMPATLLPFLKAALKRNRELHIFIVAWDYSVIYALEREFLPSLVFSHAHPRLHFVLDNVHAVGASHHQKLVVIDDCLAFTGGMDLTIRRWDRAAHALNDRQRVDPDDAPYAPMHDVQICVDGQAASALSELARDRLERARAERRHGIHGLIASPKPPLVPCRPGQGRDLWPSTVKVDFIATPVGISRTMAVNAQQDHDVHEIEALNRRAILGARDYVYIENQYLTSSSAAAAMLESLKRPSGPEIIVVLPKFECGWLERSSMGVLRTRVLQRLRSGDRHHRLHLYYPKLPGESAENTLNVHAKLILVDGRLLKIGSSNLSNRSQGLDTECDLTLDAGLSERGAARTRRGIEGVLHRLLAEHLDLSPADCAAALASGSLLELIESRRGGARCLEPLPEEAAEPVPVDLGALGDRVVDPERPMAAETFMQGLFPADLRHPLLRSLGASLAMLTPVLLMAWLCHGSGTDSLADWPLLNALRHSPYAFVYVWIGYAIGGLLFVPITLLLAATVVLFDPYHGFFYGLSGSLLSASVSYVIGRTWRGATLRHLQGRHARTMHRLLRVQAFRATLLARLLPAGNFTASNLLAGALNLTFLAFFLGNLGGLAFGVAWLVVLADTLAHAFSQPSLQNIALVSLTAACMLALSFGLANFFAKPRRVIAAPASAGANRA